MTATRSALFLSTLIASTVAAADAVAEDFRDKFPQIEASSPHGVNLQSGKLSLSETDLTLGPITLERRYTSNYSSSAPSTAPLAVHYATHPLNAIGSNLRGFLYWKTETGSVTLIKIYVRVEGQILEFLHYSGTAGRRRWNIEAKGWRLYPSGSDYILQHKSGRVYRFVDHAAIPASGEYHKPMLLSSVESPDGDRLDYSYSSTGNLTSVASNRGYRLNFVYGTNQITACGFNLSVTYATATSTCSGAQMQVAYNIGTTGGATGQIASMTRVDGSVVNYQFNANRVMTCETLPDSSTCRITNEYWPLHSPTGGVSVGNSYDQVTRQTTAAGEVWNYEYDFSQYAGDAPPLAPQDLTQENKRLTYGKVTDPLGNNTIAYFLVGFPEYIEAPAGRTDFDHSGVRIGVVPVGSYPTTPFTFSYFSMVPTGIKYPEGNTLRFVYDEAGNNTEQLSIPKDGSGESNIEVSRTYPSAVPFASTDQTQICYSVSQILCDKHSAEIDALGNQTDFTYDAAHGGVLTETGPAVNGVRPQKRYSYVQRNAMVKNASGSFVAMQPPVWLLASERYCKTSAASGAGCVAANDLVIKTYEYGPTTGANNLLLRGTVDDSGGPAPIRTCYTYDAAGNRISETRPATGTSCP